MPRWGRRTSLLTKVGQPESPQMHLATASDRMKPHSSRKLPSPTKRDRRAFANIHMAAWVIQKLRQRQREGDIDRG